MFNSKRYHSEADSDAVSVNSSASESGSEYSLGPVLGSFDWNDDTAVDHHVNENDAEEPGGVLPVLPRSQPVIVIMPAAHPIFPEDLELTP